VVRRVAVEMHGVGAGPGGTIVHGGFLDHSGGRAGRVAAWQVPGFYPRFLRLHVLITNQFFRDRDAP
jgi:hypothetical protein